MGQAHRVALNKSIADLSDYFRREPNLLDEKDERARTPLMIAIDAGREDAACALIDLGADVNVGDRHGETPLMAAAARGFERLVTRLIEAGAEVNAVDGADGLSAVDRARLGEHDGVVAVLQQRMARSRST